MNRAGETRERLLVLGEVGAAAAAGHALYQFDVLAVLVLALEAEIHPAIVAAVGALLVGFGAGMVP